MKPRIKREIIHFMDPTLGGILNPCEGWNCEGLGYAASGYSLEAAYQKWFWMLPQAKREKASPKKSWWKR